MCTGKIMNFEVATMDTHERIRSRIGGIEREHVLAGFARAMATGGSVRICSAVARAHRALVVHQPAGTHRAPVTTIHHRLDTTIRSIPKSPAQLRDMTLARESRGKRCMNWGQHEKECGTHTGAARERATLAAGRAAVTAPTRMAHILAPPQQYCSSDGLGNSSTTWPRRPFYGGDMHVSGL